MIHQSYENCSVSHYMCIFLLLFLPASLSVFGTTFFFTISLLLFPFIICVLTQQQHNFMPGGAAEETEPFHVQRTVGLIQKKTNFFLARVKPICSCTKFLCTLSWLQRKTEWEWDSVTQNPCQPQCCACCLPGSEQGLCS